MLATWFVSPLILGLDVKINMRVHLWIGFLVLRSLWMVGTRVLNVATVAWNIYGTIVMMCSMVRQAAVNPPLLMVDGSIGN